METVFPRPDEVQNIEISSTSPSDSSEDDEKVKFNLNIRMVKFCEKLDHFTAITANI